MYFIGLMSGTSMDAVDTALVDIDEDDVTVIAYKQFPIPKALQARVRAVNSASSIDTITELDSILGELFASAVEGILAASDTQATAIAAIGSHGQTVLHLPEAQHARTLQIGDANIIACKTGITTIADFRRMDMAAAGQGAPLASAFHAWRFQQAGKARVVLNIGGMANVTILPAEADSPVSGFDTGPGNALMDDWIQRHLHKDYDTDGQWAASGTVDTALLHELMQCPFFEVKPPKSTGKDDFNLQWLDSILKRQERPVAAADVQATLLELSARSISDAVKRHCPDCEEILVCGGGLHNRQLMQALRHLLAGMEICSTGKYGINPDALEAIVFAWLAKRRLHKQPGNMPAVTGASREVLLGAIYHV